MSSADLAALLSQLRPRSQASPSQPSHTSRMSVDQSRDLSTSFLSASQVPQTPPPPFSPSPSNANSAPSNPIAQNLLNLLNFNNPSAQTTGSLRTESANFGGSQSSATQPSQAQRSLSEAAQDRTDGHVPNHSSNTQPHSPLPHSLLGGSFEGHRATPDRAEPLHQSTSNVAASKEDPAAFQEDVGRGSGVEGINTQNPSAAQEQPKPLFTYKNPFEALRASRPHTPRSPKPTIGEMQQPPPQEETLTQSIEDSDMRDELSKIMPDRIKLTPKSRTTRQDTPPQSSASGQELQVDAQNGDQANHQQIEASVLANGEPNNEPTSQSTQAQDVEQARNNVSMAETQGQNQEADHKLSAASSQGSRIVPVLTFPVKAFVSITLQLKHSAATHVREDGVMEISRLKKEFDQIDRSLAAASSKYITYALVKNGGMRIIRQEDGKDRHIFKHSHDRIFNVSVGTTSIIAAPGDHQTVLGTGVSGAVYYATVSRPEVDFFDSDSLDTESLCFPAYPQTDENTAGGVLKTRAKRSSRHPEFFAIGRGKLIHIVWPSTVLSPRYGVTNTSREVDVEKLFQERSLQIQTGKAGKDYTFSEDDTMIVSLDKTGRLRFWDIRKLIDEENARSVQITPYVIDTPVLSLSTASPAERSWPTSVLFVDKARPYTKGGALRYVLVGLRQNHTLQLWDIALGKAVQEINFPHESETDGICSVAYHPTTGIIVVGHPTQNSIFFIHLSAPRYVLSSTLSQASYVQRVAAKDPDIPKPESTACMSGIREISFEGRGRLRSIELLPVYKSTMSAPEATSEPLFELYVAHSTGVTCLVINKDDLGWDVDNKVVNGVSAEKEGLVILRDLKLGSIIEENTGSKSPVQDTPSTKPKKKSKKVKDNPEEGANGVQEATAQPQPTADLLQQDVQPAESAVVDHAPAKESKKSKKKKEAQLVESATATKPETARTRSAEKTDTVAPPVPDVSTNAATRQAADPGNSLAEQLSMSISGDWLDKELKKVEKGVANEIKKELDQLHQDIKTDRASQDQASASRQEAVLRVVSTTLNTNVEKSLSRILATQMQEVVVPLVVQTVSKDIGERVTQTVSQLLRKEIVSEIPAQLNTTLRSPQMLQSIAASIAQPLTEQISVEIDKIITTNVASSMKSIASSTANEIVAAAEARIDESLAQLQRQQTAQAETMTQLQQTMQSVASTLQTMSQAQVAFQNQVLQDKRASQTQQDLSRTATSVSASPAPSIRPMPAKIPSKAEQEIDEVTTLMEQRKYEEGSIKWLQSSQPVKLFDELFVRFTPDYLATDVSPLVAFSIGVTVANSLSTNTKRRLEWIDAAFDTVDFKDREINELSQHAPQLINALIQKLESLYMSRAEQNPTDVVLAMIPPLAKKARDLKTAFQVMGENRMAYV